jgi:sarcosine oxidase, subunit beta
VSSGPRVVVVGGGVAGLSAAMHCARLGARSVTVLERKQLAAGSSALSAGIFNQQTADPADQEMRSASIRVLEDLEARGLLTLHRCGYLRLARSAEQWRSAHGTFAHLTDPNARLVTTAEVAALVPGMRVDDVHGAMYGPRDGHVDGAELCQAYLAVAREHGAELRQWTEVTGMTARHGQRIVHTAEGDFAADVVINAAGPWFDRVGALLGCQVPLANERHQIAIIAVPSLAGQAIPTVQTYFPGEGEKALYLRPEGPGQFIGGLHSYETHGASEDPDGFRRSMDDDYLEDLAERLLDRFPGWEDATLRPGWTGLYPLSPDGRYVIGPHPNDEQVIALGGLGGVGLTVSGSTGSLAAEWAVNGRASSVSDTTAAIYHPDRLEGSS